MGTQVQADPYADNIVYRPGAGEWFLAANPGAPGLYPDPGVGPAVVTSAAAWGVPGYSPLIGDVNGDGLDDVVALTNDPAFTWLAGHSLDTGGGVAQIGSQSFPAADSAVVGFGTAAGNLGTFLADVNGDGADDALTINAGFNWVGSLSTPNVGLGGAAGGPAQFGLPDDQPIVGDFNGDGLDDIGVYRPTGGNVFWTGSAAGGVLGGLGLGPIGQIGGNVGQDSLLIANLDGDAYDDAVMVRQDGVGAIEWFGLLNDGTGSLDFFNPGTSLSSFGVDNGGDLPFVADINGDGLDDIGVSRGGQNFVTFTGAGGVLGTNVAGDENWAFGFPDDIQMFGNFGVPEPASLLLLSLGGVFAARRR